MSRSFKEYLTTKDEERKLKAKADAEVVEAPKDDEEESEKKSKKKKKDPVAKKNEIDVEPETNEDETENETEYPHDMWHQKTGEKKVALDQADHEALSKMGYTEEEPEPEEDDDETEAEVADDDDKVAKDLDKDTKDDDEDKDEDPKDKDEDPKASTKDIQRHNPKKYVNIAPVMNEALSKTAVMTWGRMNPVTIGHEKLISAVIKTAVQKKGIPLIYLSHSVDKKKNPLPYDQKILFAKAAFGPKIIVKSTARTIIDVAKELSRKFDDLVMVVGSDRVKEFDTMLNKYNGKDYSFNSIEVISAGDRDPDSDGVTGMSASKMRVAAEKGDLASFKKGLPRKLQSKAKSVYGAVRAGMGIDEGYEEIEQDYLEEALTRQQRLKRKMIMRRMKGKIAMGRKRALKKRATLDVLKRRSRKLVYRLLKKRFSKGTYGEMPYSARQRVDDRIKKIPKNRIDTLMRRFLPNVKAAQAARLAAKIKKPGAATVKKPKPIKILKKPEMISASFDNQFEAFIAERVAAGKLVPNSPMGKQKLTGREVAQYYKDNPAAKRASKDTEIKLGIELALDLSGNMNYAIKEIEKIKRNLSKHPEIKKALQVANESYDTEKLKLYTFEQRIQQEVIAEKAKTAQDPDVKDIEGTQPKHYYKGVKKDTKDDRAKHFKSKSKMDDDNPKAYAPAPGDKDPKTGELKKTKPSDHTKEFKKMFGEDKVKKRPHMLLARNGKPVIDKRFKQFRNGPDQLEADRQRKIAAIMKVAEDVEFIFNESSKEALKNKADKTGMSYGVLKKVFDRGVAAWRTGHRPGTTPTQWGLARVNSFATKSKGTWGGADKDLAAKVRK